MFNDPYHYPACCTVSPYAYATLYSNTPYGPYAYPYVYAYASYGNAMNVYFLSRVHYEKAYELNTTNGPYVY